MGLASVLLVLSPFTQINTPYPSTAYLKGYLEAKGVRAGQTDLGIETILALFSTQGLGELFAEIERRKGKYPAKVRGMLANKQRYIDIPLLISQHPPDFSRIFTFPSLDLGE